MLQTYIVALVMQLTSPCPLTDRFLDRTPNRATHNKRLVSGKQTIRKADYIGEDLMAYDLCYGPARAEHISLLCSSGFQLSIPTALELALYSLVCQLGHDYDGSILFSSHFEGSA